jgi:NADH:ubiquinone oxidoreductase subunit C
VSPEEKIKQDLVNKFKFLDGKIDIPRARRIFTQVCYADFMKLFVYAAQDLKFCHLCTITGLDEGEFLSFIYHLSHDSGITLNIKTSVPKENPVIKTVTEYFAGADCYERELMDLFGAKVDGLAAGNRYPLTDDFPHDQFPLRKDWKPLA